MPVSETEISALAASHDIVSIGMEADAVRREKHGNRTTFVRVATVDAAPGAPLDWPAAAGEVRIAGVPPTPAAAVARVREVVERANGAPVAAFSLAELEQLAIREQITLRAILEDLHAVGLDLVAEAPFDELQDPRRSIEEVNIAGLALARLTVHKLPSADALSWMKRIADLQQTVGVIRAFAPLPRQVNPAVPTTGYDDVKRVALARLMVPNIPSIQVDWALYGPKLAQVALTVGADDVDAVSAEDDMSQGRRRAPLEEILRNIRAAGQEPVERNGRFETIARMTIRLGAVGYLNARPLVFGLDQNPRFDVRYDVPSECARLLHAHEIDVGLIPSIEYLRGPQPYAFVPGPAVTSRGPVASVAIYTRREPRDIRTIAMDTSSRTSVALATILMRRRFDVEISAVAMEPQLDVMLERADAALIIGDPALFLDHAKSGAQKIDLGDEWTTATGLPFVYALWAGWPHAVSPEDVEALQHARDAGVENVEQIAATHSPGDRDRQALVSRYLRDNIRYFLGCEEIEGLETFYRYATEMGLASYDGDTRYYHAEHQGAG